MYAGASLNLRLNQTVEFNTNLILVFKHLYMGFEKQPGQEMTV